MPIEKEYKPSDDFKEKCERLAQAQRGIPESAMNRLQHTQICQLYGWGAEHIGDLTNRMAESVWFMMGGYGAVYEKVKKLLYSLTYPYGFWKECEEQIVNNVEYGKKYPSVEAARAILFQKAQEYANAHRALVVYNEAQMTARDAAVAYGEFRFGEAIFLLRKLEAVLDQGREAWEAYALKEGFQ